MHTKQLEILPWDGFVAFNIVLLLLNCGVLGMLEKLVPKSTLLEVYQAFKTSNCIMLCLLWLVDLQTKQNHIEDWLEV